MKKTEKNYYQSLYQVASIMNSERTAESLLHSIVESVAKAMGAKACSMMLLTPDRELLLHTVAYGLSDRYLRKGPIRADKSISDSLKGKPVAVLNATEDERVLYREQAREEGIASILSVPMKLRGEVIGVVRVYTAEPYRFTRDDINFAETVANLGAVALENLRAYDIIQKDYESFRREMLQWRAELGDEWTAEQPVVPAKERGPVIPPGG
ncbi:MAG: GAF domain-containing protein [Chloroflexi bacterium]|nr:GAF domain-containing protein [Chloroflexota bacterium]